MGQGSVQHPQGCDCLLLLVLCLLLLLWLLLLLLLLHVSRRRELDWKRPHLGRLRREHPSGGLPNGIFAEYGVEVSSVQSATLCYAQRERKANAGWCTSLRLRPSPGCQMYLCKVEPPGRPLPAQLLGLPATSLKPLWRI